MKTIVVLSLLMTLCSAHMEVSSIANENIAYSCQNNNGWEYIGDVVVYWKKGTDGYYGHGKLYVKIIGGKTFYKLERDGDEYAVTKNTGTEYPDCKYKAGRFYFNYEP